jgi:hypothetical protein
MQMSNIDYQNLLAGLELRGMSVEEFAVVARLAGIRFCSRARLNEAFRDRPLRNDVAIEIWRLWEELEWMANETYSRAPWAVMSFSDGKRVYTSLELFRGWRALKDNEEK